MMREPGAPENTTPPEKQSKEPCQPPPNAPTAMMSVLDASTSDAGAPAKFTIELWRICTEINGFPDVGKAAVTELR